MNLILDIAVIDKSGQSAFTPMRKQLPVDYVVPPGIHYSDPQWGDDPKVPTAVILDVEGDWCLLQFDDDVYPSKEELDYAIDAYRANGWRRPSEWPL